MIDLRVGDCRDVMAAMEPRSVDAIVTDPPYALTANKRGGTGQASLNLDSPAGRSRIGTGGGFMGKAWDGAIPGIDVWVEAWRVAKPGAHLLAFGGTRTFHRLICAIEDAEWEIRDCIMWVYGSGFPKSLSVARAIDPQGHAETMGAWDGWGTALKPAWEPIIVARKPFSGTVAANVDRHGVGAVNIDGCRIPVTDAAYARNCSGDRGHDGTRDRGQIGATDFRAGGGSASAGRWPANLIHDGSDEVVELFPREAGAFAPVHRRNSDKTRNTFGAFAGNVDEQGSTFRGDAGSAARFFYCAKATREDRNEGLAGMEKRDLNWSAGTQSPGTFQSPGTDRAAENFHPTVKPTTLMRYLCRLVTPPDGLVFDPFMGSGSTGKAARLEGFQFVGCDIDPEYVEIARRRIGHVVPEPQQAVLA